MDCVAPQLFRNRQTRQYLLAPCERWSCPACGRMLAARWRAILQWVTDHGQAPQYLVTLTLRNALPLWREAPPFQQAQQKAAAAALAQFLTRLSPAWWRKFASASAPLSTWPSSS